MEPTNSNITFLCAFASYKFSIYTFFVCGLKSANKKREMEKKYNFHLKKTDFLHVEKI